MSSTSYSIEHFQTLIQRFPVWAELRDYLESDAGGRLRIVEPAVAGSPYFIIRYTKGESDLGSAQLGVGLFRSVVWNTVTNRPVCVAPPKAREGMPPTGTQLAATEDFVDGFMVNAFVEGGAAGSGSGNLVLATRTQIGGSNSFYSKKTFGQMFDEALAASPLKDRAGLAAAMGVGSFASFVVQHPEHRIVAKVVTPSLSVVHVGSVDAATGVVTMMERPVGWTQSLARLQVPSYPLRKFASEQEIKDLLTRTAVQRGWRWQGLVFKDGAGGRWRLRTPTYTLLRELRGSESTSVERFLRLRGQGNVPEYLKHYNEERQQFWDFEQRLRARTSDVLAAYVDCHKAHAVGFKQLPEWVRPAVFQLHLKWLNELRAKGYKVRIQNAIGVVNALRPFEQRRLLEAAPYVAVTHTEAAPEGEEQDNTQAAPTEVEAAA